MGKLNKLLKKFGDKQRQDIHISLPARIEKYYPNNMRADIVLLYKKTFEDGESVEIPPILNCPIRTLKTSDFVIRMPYQKGDVVQVVFSERALDNLLITGKSETPDIQRIQSIDDAIVTGGLILENEQLNSDYTEDLLIENTTNDSRIVMEKSGNVRIECANAVVKADSIKLGSDESGEGASLGTTLKGWLDGHSHPIAWTDPAGSGVSGAPSSPSPAPSSKVFLE